MMKILIVDWVRRSWKFVALQIGLVGTMAFMSAELPNARIVVWSAAMPAAWFASMGLILGFGLRPFAYLPVTQLDLWRAHLWIASGLSTIVTLTIVMAAVIIMPGVSSVITPDVGEFLVIVSVLTGAGVLGVIGLVARFGGRAGVWPQLIVSLFSSLGPLTTEKGVPTRLSEVTSTGAVILSVAALLSAYALVHRPVLPPRPQVAPSRKLQTRDEGTARATRDWLPGLARLYVRSFLLTVAAVVVGASGVAAYWSLAGRQDWATPFELFRFLGATPMASDLNHGDVLPIGVLALVILPDVMTSTALSSFRALRTLPLSASGLAGRLSMFGLTSSAGLWVGLAVLHVLLVGAPPPSARLDLFLLIAAAVTASGALRTAAPAAQLAPFLTAGLFLAPLARQIGALYGTPPASASAVVMVVSVGVIATSWLWTRRALVRNPKIYRGPMIFGIKIGVAGH